MKGRDKRLGGGLGVRRRAVQRSQPSVEAGDQANMDEGRYTCIQVGRGGGSWDECTDQASQEVARIPI